MIIIRKDQLKLVEPTHELMTKPPALFDFEKDKESAVGVAKVLFERMKQLGGVGLSANQVGLDMRLFVMGMQENMIAVFNPEIVSISDTESSFNEGCLSYPGIMLMVKRPDKINVRYTDEFGELNEIEFVGLTARIFQHEYDHMMGTDYTKLVSPFKLEYAKKKFENKRKKLIKKYAVKTMIDALNKATEEDDAKVE